jgi:ABC-type multidrug transport system ATPase subunit
MEECEALCHRAGIMVGGRLRCLGPIQGLKSEHGSGYSLDLRVGDGAIESVRGLIEARVPGASLTEDCATRLRYRLPSSAVARVFALLEDGSNKGLVQDYQLGQTTLEEVFLRFAEGGEVEEE